MYSMCGCVHVCLRVCNSLYLDHLLVEGEADMWREMDPDSFRPFSIPFHLEGETQVSGLGWGGWPHGTLHMRGGLVLPAKQYAPLMCRTILVSCRDSIARHWTGGKSESRASCHLAHVLYPSSHASPSLISLSLPSSLPPSLPDAPRSGTHC